MSKIINCVIKVGEARADWWKRHMSSLLPNINFFLMRENYEKDRENYDFNKFLDLKKFKSSRW